MKEWLLIALIGYVIYELIEHLGLPLYWVVRNRKRAAACGPDAMPGKRCTVKQWQGTQGKVTYQNELWQAECPVSLNPGSEATILEIDGLTLKVMPLEEKDPSNQGIGSIL